MLKLDDAKLEIQNKTIKQIHEETAWKWASRAAAAYERSAHAGVSQQLAFLLDAEEYFSEAKEHAAQVDAALLVQIINAVKKYKDLT